MQGPNEYNFIYNDGVYQIREEEILNEDKNDPEVRKYYQVDKNYHLVASFKDKKEALLWVGWKNSTDFKGLFKDLNVNKETKETKELKE